MRRGERGQSASEYVLLVLLIAVAAVAVLAALSGGPLRLLAIARQTVLGWLRNWR